MPATISHPSLARASSSLAILVLAYTFSFIDRTILAMLVGPIKAELHLSDTQISLLTGLAFAIFYTALGLPFGMIVDKASRRGLAAAGVAVWSLMTVLCGAATNYWGLLAARIGVATGEATLSPAAYSLIPDLFRPEHRSRAQGVYAMGACFGSGLAFLIGGWTIMAVSGLPPVSLPLLGEFSGWRLVFLVVGAPGLLVALLVLAVAEPRRKAARPSLASPSLASPSLAARPAAALSALRRHWQAYGVVIVGCSVVNIAFHGLSAWAPTLLGRVHQLEQGQIGLILGLGFLGPGCVGLLLGGWVADRWLAAGRIDANLRMALIGALGAAAMLSGLILSPGLLATVVLLYGAIFMMMFPMGAAPAALQIICPPDLRGRIAAVYMLALNLIGMGVGPTAVALLTDYAFADPLAVGRSMGLVGLTAGLIAAGLITLGRPSFRALASR
ncbi:MFS transporter [Phenylobacterium sp.]|uniref:MFS transporter n=1 Tax=Phenylobacterium sp. TaxID=1871053 RepID=UPI0027314665|nr:MFS transporter [Phenylobacterium sp.]MDP1616352.1 MFS transporter [Phenylobacterium sp.]MDP1988200.1 MFS transporter [Phenylobacterium sp.]